MAEKGTGLFLGGTEIQLIQNNKFALVDPSPSTFNIEYLVYAAGGTGGNRLTYDGGGGGAGGLLSGSAEIYTQNYYQITPGSFTGLGINEIALTGGNGGGGNNTTPNNTNPTNTTKRSDSSSTAVPSSHHPELWPVIKYYLKTYS